MTSCELKTEFNCDRSDKGHKMWKWALISFGCPKLDKFSCCKKRPRGHLLTIFFIYSNFFLLFVHLSIFSRIFFLYTQIEGRCPVVLVALPRYRLLPFWLLSFHFLWKDCLKFPSSLNAKQRQRTNSRDHKTENLINIFIWRTKSSVLSYSPWVLMTNRKTNRRKRSR